MEYDDKVEEGLIGDRGGSNRDCDYYPCHHDGQDCTFCFCPWYPCEDGRLGGWVTSSRTGEPIWGCSGCTWIHRTDVARTMLRLADERGVHDAPSFRDLVPIADVLAEHPPAAPAVMFLGATSGAGKSLLTAGMCRLLSDRGMRVSPFKSQNMSLNSTVTPDGLEISRAQALQARAAREVPMSFMNPILLKPMHDDVSQIVVEGLPLRDTDVRSYYGGFTANEGTAIVRRNLERIRGDYDAVVIEGAGSPAEINIHDEDISNMRVAELADAACVLVINMEWGGAFAYAVGTLGLLPPEERSRFVGIVLNNMRGDVDRLGPGIERLGAITGVPVIGTLPHLDLDLPDEDSMDIADGEGDGLVVAVVRLPRISNFTDFDALAMEEGVVIRYVTDARGIAAADAIVIPGTKNTMSDLGWMRDNGIADAIVRRRGEVPIVGICGGYQMLGRTIDDPQGIESPSGGTQEGLGLLEVRTTFDEYDKRTVRVEGRTVDGGHRVRGYEIHMGETVVDERPFLIISDGDGEHEEGALSEDGRVMGTYLHGLFDLPGLRRELLSMCGGGARDGAVDLEGGVESSLDRLATAMREHLDLGPVLDALGVDG